MITREGIVDLIESFKKLDKFHDKLSELGLYSDIYSDMYNDIFTKLMKIVSDEFYEEMTYFMYEQGYIIEGTVITDKDGKPLVSNNDEMIDLIFKKIPKKCKCKIKEKKV